MNTGFAISLVILALVGTAWYSSTLQLIDSNRMVGDALRALTTLQSVSTHIREAESAQRRNPA